MRNFVKKQLGLNFLKTANSVRIEKQKKDPITKIFSVYSTVKTGQHKGHQSIFDLEIIIQGHLSENTFIFLSKSKSVKQLICKLKERKYIFSVKNNNVVFIDKFNF